MSILILWMSAVIATRSFLNRSSMPKRELFRSGPERSTLFREIPWCCALKSNTTRICPSFCRWCTPRMGKYQHSSSSWIGGTLSEKERQKTVLLYRGFYSTCVVKNQGETKLVPNYLGVMVWVTLMAKEPPSIFSSFWWNAVCMIFKKISSTKDMAC